MAVPFRKDHRKPMRPCAVDAKEIVEHVWTPDPPKGHKGWIPRLDKLKYLHATKTITPRNIGIFSYAEPWDYFLFAVGTTASVIHGAGFPLLSVVLGSMTTVFLRAQNSDFVTGNTSKVTRLDAITQDEFNVEVTKCALYYLALGVAMFVTSYTQIACWEAAAERLVYALRKNYLRALLRQEITWYDTKQSGNLTSRISDDLERVREGLGDKASLFIQTLSTFVAGFAIGFAYNLQMTLVMGAFAPLIALLNAWAGRVSATRTQVEQKTYAIAGGIAEEVFSAIRTVTSLNGQRQELQRYENALENARKVGLVKYLYMSVGMSGTLLVMYASYAASFWFGSRLILWCDDIDAGTIFTVFFAVVAGSTALGTALPNLSSIASAKGASSHVLSVLNAKPRIDPYSESGRVLERINGAINFENVHFSYPIRKDLKVLNGVSFSLAPGKKLAIVGPSGCGKSTIVSLLMRFYDCVQGRVTLDGHDLRELNVSSLRDAIGVVSQEPILFDGTLEENILLGNEDATRDDVIRCCTMANAYDFISKLPDGLNTRVGERGVQLSGGQKQRIAIARALIRNPKILLLDEATSALDGESERAVQAALEKAQEGRTTIIIAHRLSTIRHVDDIILLSNGEVTESGTYAQLLAQRGAFYDMVKAQEVEGSDVDKPTGAIPSLNKDHVQGLPSPTTACDSDDSCSTENSRLTGGTEVYDSEVHLPKKVHEKPSLQPTSLSKIIGMGKDTWHFLLTGLLASCLHGLVTPFFAIAYSQIFSVLGEPSAQLNDDAVFWSLMFVAIGVVSSGSAFVSTNAVGRCGEAMTKKLRFEAFRNMLRQDIGFFDDPKHSTGVLCTRFATDAPNVRYVFTRLPIVVSSVVTLGGAIMIGLIFGWKLALVLLAILPLVLFSGYVELRMRFGKNLRNTKLMEQAGKVASEAVENIRTVQALNKQRVFCDKFCENLVTPYRVNMRQAHVYGVVYGFSQSMTFIMYALGFWLGAKFVNDRSMQPADVYRVFFAFAFCGQSVGQIIAFIPDVVKARIAASRLLHLIEYPSKIDSLSSSGSTAVKIRGYIRFENVHFCYPSRSGTSVLTGLNLNVDAGETVALVGYSGSGKSTVMALLERLYNPSRGRILIDGVDIKDLNVHRLREQVAIVSQEPTLFDCTVAENICYGLDRLMSYDDIVEAAKQANIHDFVLSLPMGYDTRVGEKGTQLSGGQKQRIAIARALIRNPAVLLLDEATSALDSESEKVVQEALMNARQGRTCLIVAHRLSTVQSADRIVVIDEGKVVQAGKPQELLRQDGIYASLCNSLILSNDYAR